MRLRVRPWLSRAYRLALGRVGRVGQHSLGEEVRVCLRVYERRYRQVSAVDSDKELTPLGYDLKARNRL